MQKAYKAYRGITYKHIQPLDKYKTEYNTGTYTKRNTTKICYVV